MFKTTSLFPSFDFCGCVLGFEDNVEDDGFGFEDDDVGFGFEGDGVGFGLEGSLAFDLAAYGFNGGGGRKASTYLSREYLPVWCALHSSEPKTSLSYLGTMYDSISLFSF